MEQQKRFGVLDCCLQMAGETHSLRKISVVPAWMCQPGCASLVVCLETSLFIKGCLVVHRKRRKFVIIVRPSTIFTLREETWGIRKVKWGINLVWSQRKYPGQCLLFCSFLPISSFSDLPPVSWNKNQGVWEKVNGYFVWSPVMDICRAVLVILGKKGRQGKANFVRILQNLYLYMKRDSIMSHSWETANWYHDFFNGFPHICAHGFAVSQCLSPSKKPICIHSVTMWIINRIQDQDL